MSFAEGPSRVQNFKHVGSVYSGKPLILFDGQSEHDPKQVGTNSANTSQASPRGEMGHGSNHIQATFFRGVGGAKHRGTKFWGFLIWVWLKIKQ